MSCACMCSVRSTMTGSRFRSLIKDEERCIAFFLGLSFFSCHYYLQASNLNSSTVARPLPRNRKIHDNRFAINLSFCGWVVVDALLGEGSCCFETTSRAGIMDVLSHQLCRTPA